LSSGVVSAEMFRYTASRQIAASPRFHHSSLRIILIYHRNAMRVL